MSVEELVNQMNDAEPHTFVIVSNVPGPEWRYMHKMSVRKTFKGTWVYIEGWGDGEGVPLMTWANIVHHSEAFYSFS